MRVSDINLCLRKLTLLVISTTVSFGLATFNAVVDILTIGDDEFFAIYISATGGVALPNIAFAL